MVATIETTSEPGPRPAASACRVTAGRPQGSTGIPACEIEYPGAAAQPHPPASAGSRPAGATSGFALSPNALNLNGANTYQFVMSNPVGLADPGGVAGQGSANAVYYAEWHSNPYLSGLPGSYVVATPGGYDQHAPALPPTSWRQRLENAVMKSMEKPQRQSEEPHPKMHCFDGGATTRAVPSLEEKLAGRKQIRSLEAQRNAKRKSLFDAQDAVEQRREALIAQIEAKLTQNASASTVVAFRWRLV